MTYAALRTAAPTLQPPLKWAGGKRWLLPHLRPLWQAYAGQVRLVEPFVGGMAVALGLRPRWALLNDSNRPLVAFYRWLQRGLRIDLPLENDAELYYQHRARFNRLQVEGAGDSAEAAGLFYYLNRTGYNGLCRFNRRGLFNVPFGRHRAIQYQRDFSAYAPVMAGWELSCRPFATLPLAPDDFVYADPPYDVPFTTYSPGGFGWEDQVALAYWLLQHPGPVVASNQATPRILDLYAGLGFDIHCLPAPRLIACNGDRRPALEMLATRNLDAARLPPA